MRCARARDQTVAEGYFAAKERVELRLDTSTLLTTVPMHSGSASTVPVVQKDIEVVKVQEPERLIQLIEQLETPELHIQERLSLTSQLRRLLLIIQEPAPP